MATKTISFEIDAYELGTYWWRWKYFRVREQALGAADAIESAVLARIASAAARLVAPLRIKGVRLAVIGRRRAREGNCTVHRR